MSTESFDAEDGHIFSSNLTSEGNGQRDAKILNIKNGGVVVTLGIWNSESKNDEASGDEAIESPSFSMDLKKIWRSLCVWLMDREKYKLALILDSHSSVA